METKTNTGDNTPNSTEAEGKAKKTVIRSVAYPAFTIEDTANFITKLYKTYPNSTIRRSDAEAIIENSGYLNRTLSAGVQFGLLELVSGEGYNITKEFLPLYQSLSENEKWEAKVKAFSAPKLYQTLIQNYDGHAIPPELPIILFRKHGIAEKVSQHAADTFITNAEYAGVLDENKILRVKQTLDKLSGTPFVEILQPENKNHTLSQNDNNTVQQHNDTQQQILQIAAPIVPNIDEDELKIRVTGKKTVRIIYPLSLTKNDIEIVREQLKVLDRLIDLEKEEAT
jgi:hypothetical protein